MPRPSSPLPSKLNQYILAPLAFAVFIYVTDMILFGFVANEFFSVPGMKEMPDITLNIIGIIVGGLLFSYIYMWYGRSPDVGIREGDGRAQSSETTKGWEFGVLMALIIFLPAAIIYNSLMVDWSLTSSLVEVIYRLAQFAIAGIIVAKILK